MCDPNPLKFMSFSLIQNFATCISTLSNPRCSYMGFTKIGSSQLWAYSKKRSASSMLSLPKRYLSEPKPRWPIDLKTRLTIQYDHVITRAGQYPFTVQARSLLGLKAQQASTNLLDCFEVLKEKLYLHLPNFLYIHQNYDFSRINFLYIHQNYRFLKDKSTYM